MTSCTVRRALIGEPAKDMSVGRNHEFLDGAGVGTTRAVNATLVSFDSKVEVALLTLDVRFHHRLPELQNPERPEIWMSHLAPQRRN